MSDKPQAPAFPDGVHGGMRLRDYFAAHAPAESWPHFMPVLPPKPEPPVGDPVSNDGEAPTNVQIRNLDEWRREPHWEIDDDPEYAHFSHWCNTWRAYHLNLGVWRRQEYIERAEQWPWFYADTMLRRRGA